VLSKFSQLISGMLDKYPSKKLHLELQPNANSLHAALCSGFAHHPLPRRIDSSFWYWDLGMIGASEWEPPCYPFQARWHLSLGLYCQRLPLISKKLRLIPIIIDVLHRCSWYKSFTKLDINMHLNWIMSPGKSVSLLHPWHLSILLIAHGS